MILVKAKEDAGTWVATFQTAVSVNAKTEDDAEPMPGAATNCHTFSPGRIEIPPELESLKSTTSVNRNGIPLTDSMMRGNWSVTAPAALNAAAPTIRRSFVALIALPTGMGSLKAPG